MSVIQFAKEICEPLGVKVRGFAVDYEDESGNEYNTEVCSPMKGMSDKEIAIELILDFGSRGFRVTSIYEMLDGYSQEEIIKLMDKNPKEAAKHLKLIYWDVEKVEQ